MTAAVPRFDVCRIRSYPEKTQPCPLPKIDSKITKIEKTLAGRDDVYVARAIVAMIRKSGLLVRSLKAKHKYCCQFPKCAARILKKDGGCTAKLPISYRLRPAAKPSESTWSSSVQITIK